MRKLVVSFTNKRVSELFYQVSYPLENLGSQSLMTHTPLDIRHSLSKVSGEKRSG